MVIANKMAAPLVYVTGFVGTLLRVLLFATDFPAWIRSRRELVTPITSWDRVQEGIALQKQRISPYAGDLFHETPLLLRLVRSADCIPGGSMTLFVFVDIVAGIVLYKITQEFTRYELQRQAKEMANYSPQSKELLHTRKTLSSISIAVTLIHFLGPYSLCSCLAQTTTVFSNLAVLFCWLFTLQGNVELCCFALAVATYQSLYPVIFLVPIAMHFFQQTEPKSPQFVSKVAFRSYIRVLLVFTVWLVSLLGASFVLEGSWEFLRATYGFVLTVPDLSPNVGIFWYFFTEMFEHFRTFFICVFQINVFIFAVPLAIKLQEHPLLQLYIIMFEVCIFKSYPSYADTALALILLPLWQHIFRYMRNTLVVSTLYVVVGILAPILWHLWIYAASANANFYFAITLVFCSAQVFLIADVLYAFLRYEFDLLHGTDHRLPSKEKTRVVLE